MLFVYVNKKSLQTKRKQQYNELPYHIIYTSIYTKGEFSVGKKCCNIMPNNDKVIRHYLFN